MYMFSYHQSQKKILTPRVCFSSDKSWSKASSSLPCCKWEKVFKIRNLKMLKGSKWAHLCSLANIRKTVFYKSRIVNFHFLKAAWRHWDRIWKWRERFLSTEAVFWWKSHRMRNGIKESCSLQALCCCFLTNHAGCLEVNANFIVIRRNIILP